MKKPTTIKITQGIAEASLVALLMLIVAKGNLLFQFLASVLGIVIGFNKREITSKRERGTSEKVIKGICEKNKDYIKFSIWERALNKFWDEYKMWALIEAGWFILPLGISLRSNNLTGVALTALAFVSIKAFDMMEFLMMKKSKRNVALYLEKLTRGEEYRC